MIQNYPFHYRWVWDLQSSPEQLWALVADTNRFNFDTGVPSVYPLRNPDYAGRAGRQLLRMRVFGVPIEWEEQPFEWVRPKRFGVVRSYSKGPVAEMRIAAELTPRPEGGTRMIYEVWVRPANPLGYVAIPVQVGLISGPRFAAVVRAYDKRIAAGGSFVPNLTGPTFAAGGEARLTSLAQQLVAEGGAPDLVRRLVETIRTFDIIALSRLRPYALADAWGASRREVLELCLLATRLSLLDFSWDLLCPLCRGSRQQSKTLGGVVSRVHCDSCNIDFDVNFDRSVELTFRPNAAICEVIDQPFCVGGPEITPHIVMQQLIASGSQRTLTLQLEPGRYRLRARDLPGGRFLKVEAGGGNALDQAVQLQGWPDTETLIAPTLTLRLDNMTPDEQLLILERTAWSDQAATAAEVTALQRFRDLFASEALRPGERIAVGSLTILFTDLRGSTRLYREIGDATAFGLVMDHFAVLEQAIANEGGGIVKTIGDAVMAVFPRPIAAVRAVMAARQALANPSNPDLPPLKLKAGLHSGPCIAVTLNERLDYFGTTVNFASRLVDLSDGERIILSGAVHDDPEVLSLLGDPTQAMSADLTQATLKGFEQEAVPLWAMRQGAVRTSPPLVGSERGTLLLPAVRYNIVNDIPPYTPFAEK